MKINRSVKKATSANLSRGGFEKGEFLVIDYEGVNHEKSLLTSHLSARFVK